MYSNLQPNDLMFHEANSVKDIKIKWISIYNKKVMLKKMKHDESEFMRRWLGNKK
jgi:hypothetical protein